MKKLSKIFLFLFALFIISQSRVVLAASCDTSTHIDTVLGCIPKGGTVLQDFVGNAFAWVAGIISTISMLGLIYAGYVYITSAGNPDRIAYAKDVILTSLAALLIVIFSWALFHLLGVNTSGTGNSLNSNYNTPTNSIWENK